MIHHIGVNLLHLESTIHFHYCISLYIFIIVYTFSLLLDNLISGTSKENEVALVFHHVPIWLN